MFQTKVDGGWNILRRSVTVVEGKAAVKKEGGVQSDLLLQGPNRTEPLEKTTSRCQHQEVSIDVAEGPDFEKGGIVIEEVTVPLDLSNSAGQCASIDQRPLPGRFGGATVGANHPAPFLQQADSGFVRLPEISPSVAGSLRRTASELPLIGLLYLQRESERKPEKPEVESRDTSSSSLDDYDPDSHPSPMGDNRRIGGPSISGGEGPFKRSMPSTTTLSSGSSFNVAANSRRPSKIQPADCADGLVVPGGSPTTRQHDDDDVFLRPMPRQTSTRDDRYPPSTILTGRVSTNRRSSMPHTRNGDIAKDTVSPQISALSEAALRTLDEMNLANDMSRVQNNLERFQRTARMAQPTARLSLQQTQQPTREKKNSFRADAGGHQRRPPAAAAGAAAGGKGLLRTSKSQPNLIHHQRLQQHQQLYQQQQSVRNPVNGSRNARKAQQFKSEDLEDEEDDYDEDDERTDVVKRERIVRWLIGANECAEPPPFPTVIEEERPPQTDNAIHIVYTGE